jgi:hypothetical protein
MYGDDVFPEGRIPEVPPGFYKAKSRRRRRLDKLTRGEPYEPER